VTVVEICVDDVEGARAAEREGADRIELCAGLSESGITPSIGMVTATLAAVSRVGVQVLIRPRGGDFGYTRDEVQVMCADIRAICALPARVPVGFVLNALTSDGKIDRLTMAALLVACHGAPTTFSRAFDAAADPLTAADDLADLGVDRILTGGGLGTAAEGRAALARLVQRSPITVLAAGHIRSTNAAPLVAATSVPEIHLRAPGSGDARARTSATEVRAVVAAVRGITS